MITKKQFTQLQSYSGSAVSIYIPTLITGDYDKNRIRWKNAIDEAERKLSLPPREQEALLQPAKDLLDDEVFWAHQSNALAGFFGKDINAVVHLKSPCEKLVSVHNDFYLYPLLQEMTRPERIFVLALSGNETRFFEAQYDGIYPVKISDIVVDDQREALQHQDKYQSLQHHSIDGGSGAYFHANGPGADMDDVRLEQYFRRVDDGLMEMLFDETAPLVVAGVEGYPSKYRALSKYNNVSNHAIIGNPEQLTPVDIHQQLKPVFEDLYNRRMKSFEERFGAGRSEGKSLTDLSDFYQAAAMKNVGGVVIGTKIYTNMTSGEKEQLDDAVLAAYQNGADVYFSEKAEGLRAIRRWVMETA